MQEEVEGVRQEVRDVKGESKVEESRSLHVERENSSVESTLSLQELCRFTTDFRLLRKVKRGGR